MKYFFALFFLLVTCCLTQVGHGQSVSFHPYVGGALNFGGISQPGWGIDAGLKVSSFYAGVEYGSYGHEVNTVDLEAGEAYHEVFEDYYGAHGGVVIDSVAYFGLVFLHSYHQDVIGDITYWFNVGPDVRLQATKHFVLALAYTIRRGLNLGLNLLF